MTHVVFEPCHDCKYTDCVVVCPADCFYQDEKQLYIDPMPPPEGCTDCQACVPECPVEAIFADSDVPAKWTSFVDLNTERSAALKAGGGNITAKQGPQKGAGCIDPDAG